MINAANREIPDEILKRSGFITYSENNPRLLQRSYLTLSEKEKKNSKIIDGLEVAIREAGLKDGMTISFHHHFREGEKIVNMVIDKIAEMGYKNIRIAPSSLLSVHEPLIGHIRNGVITRIETSGLRGKLANEISHCLMEEPIVFRSHGGRAAAIQNGELHIDIAFLGAASCDPQGNASGYTLGVENDAACGSLGYAKVDAQYADKVIVLTNNIVSYPNVPCAIPETQVDYIVEVESIGDPNKISSGATRVTKNPRDLLISQIAARVIEHSGYFRDGYSVQTGSGGASLAVTRFLREMMIANNITASFALGGITSQMVSMHEEGLIKKLLDVQSFDTVAAQSIKKNENHFEIDASFYANPYDQGAAQNQLDIVILSALEVDVDYNVNVLTGSDGVIRGAIGGHQDTAAGAALTILTAPLMRGRMPTVLKQVNTLITPGSTIDILVTDQGVAVNPARPEISERLAAARIPLTTIEELKNKAEKLAGEPAELPFGDKVVGLVTYRDGSILDVIRNIED